MKKEILIVLLLLILVVTGCGQKTMTLRGQVVDHKTGQSIAGVKVEVANQTVKTNQQGYFVLKEIPVVDNVAKKKRMINISAPGYKDYQQTVALREGDQSLTIELERKYMNLSGQVLDRFSGHPLAGIQVELGNQMVETDANGYFALQKIPVLSKEKMLKVSAPAYRTYAQEIALQAGTKDLTIKLEGRQETKFFFSSDQRGSRDIYITDIYGQRLQRLTTQQSDEWAPDWSAARKEVLFLSDRDGSTNIYTMAADGGEQKQLTSTATAKENPVWLDENRILYASNRDGDYDLYITTVDGSYLRRLTDNDYYDGQAVYSAKQNAVAYIAATTGEKKLHLLNLDTGAKVLLHKSAGEDRAPSWSAAGDKIVFVNYQAGRSALKQINYNGSGLKALIALEEEISDYALGDLKNQMGLYVSQQQSQNIKLLTTKGVTREILVNPQINVSDPAWKK
ncbi:carboxypeptidase regulatory-like domain-containing protein [Halanaerobacter jeridensis]|uniref:TolB protein n=1 Tax=Halanaerobacter jeridensis TaxID=706427 RepID=A0A938XXM7_9FIRM|nr:carboxypeptidase regulatory-like domain-containing protein [Halanaerobacter jeridensis]MBM7557537.1 TolB protein [Halanaerobacter jeridensis]